MECAVRDGKISSHYYHYHHDDYLAPSGRPLQPSGAALGQWSSSFSVMKALRLSAAGSFIALIDCHVCKAKDVLCALIQRYYKMSSNEKNKPSHL